MRPSRAGRMVAACAISAPVLGLLLVLIPFGGAPEHVISGVFFLALGSGWGSLAIFAARLGSQPQRWALAPAVMLTGAGLLSVSWPESVNSVLVAWIWPPILLGLVVLTGRDARRHLRSRSRRWVVYPVLVLLTLAAVGGAYETIAEALDAVAHPAPGRMVEVNGHRLHLRCHGTRRPTVVLISGFGEVSSVWSWIAEDVGREARVCSYDPAGRAWSESIEEPQDAIARARDLHDLLEKAGEVGPHVFVGHSFGGLHARAYAARYPEDVAGMVLLDATSPDMFSLPSYPRFYEGYRRVSALFPSLARLGVGRLAYASSRSGLPAQSRDEILAFLSTARLARDQRDEWAGAPAAMVEAQSLTTIGDKPLVIVTAGRGAQEGWLPLQRQMTELSTNVLHRILPDATHSGLLENQRDAAESSRAIRDVVTAVRHSSRLEAE